jgi:hypothetical protein
VLDEKKKMFLSALLTIPIIFFLPYTRILFHPRALQQNHQYHLWFFRSWQLISKLAMKHIVIMKYCHPGVSDRRKQL